MSDILEKVRDENKVREEAFEENLVNGTYTHVGLMQCKSKIGSSVMFLMAYDFDKNWQHIQSVFGTEEMTKGLADCASKYNLINENLLVDQNFDPVSLAVEMGIRNNKLGDIDDLNCSDWVVNSLRDIRHSFGVEADIKSGSMLAPDKEKLIEILKMRKEELKRVKEGGGIDNMLAIEKVFVDGEKNPLEINSLRTIIGGFHHIRTDSKEGYKSKVDEAQSKGIWENVDGLPRDDGLFDLHSHDTRLEVRCLQILKAAKAETVDIDKDLAIEEASVVIERRKIIITLSNSYERIQKQVLQPEKETAKTKEASAEIGM